jgi:hypothetical protein
MSLNASSGDFSGFGATTEFSPFGPLDRLPLLPPPPPESPPAPLPGVEQSSDLCPSAPKPCRSQPEVDKANIITSTCSRAPTARKRTADEDASNRPQKKGEGQPEGNQGVLFNSTLCSVLSNSMNFHLNF